jgi:hypothetical protein
MNLSRYSVSALPFAKALTTHLAGNIINFSLIFMQDSGMSIFSTGSFN